MRKLTKIIGVILATLLLVTTLVIAAEGIPGTVKEVKGSTVIVSDNDGNEHAIPVGKDAAARLRPGDQVTVQGGKVKKVK